MRAFTGNVPCFGAKASLGAGLARRLGLVVDALASHPPTSVASDEHTDCSWLEGARTNLRHAMGALRLMGAASPGPLLPTVPGSPPLVTEPGAELGAAGGC